MKKILWAAFLWLLFCAGCGERSSVSGKESVPPEERSASIVSGEVKIDGSSTVYPISEAVAEEFMKLHPQVNVTVAKSGTGGGFKKFIATEVDIADASRLIEAQESADAQTAGVSFIELPIAYDGLSVVANRKNHWAQSLTVDELKRIWITGSKVANWQEIRPGFPNCPLKLYGPGTDSGTFDYFTEAICGKKGASRADYTASEDDNVLVTGVAGDEGALGYFGMAYYEENRDKLNLIAIDAGKRAVAPSPETIVGGTYQPLSRPLFLYVSRAAAERPEVRAFVEFYLTRGKELIRSVGYIPLPDRAYDLAGKRFREHKTGTLFGGKAPVGVKIEDLLARESAGQ